jgi:hypothetical protein
VGLHQIVLLKHRTGTLVPYYFISVPLPFMYMRCFSLAVLLSAGLLLSCKKVNFGPDGGITEKTAQNYPNGHVDSSDWSSDATWNKQELDLFKGLPLDLNSAQQGGVLNLSFFPNPVSTQAQFSIGQLGGATSMSLIVTDKKYKVVQDMQNTSGYNAYQIDFSKLTKGEAYRMYYVFYTGNTLYSKGHGDIKIAD